MNRVENAIKNRKCVLAVNPELLEREDLLNGLNKIGASSISLGENPTGSVNTISDDCLDIACNGNGVVVLVDPNFNSPQTKKLAGMVKSAQPKPLLIVVAKAFNRFALPLNMRLMKIHHIKMRPDLFINELAEKEEEENIKKVESTKKKSAKSTISTGEFVGRKEEKAQLIDMLESDGRPVMVSGAAGIGKRWLVEAALSETKLKRLPDCHLDAFNSTDAFIGRIAVAAAGAGDNSLMKALKARTKRPAPKEISALVVKSLQNKKLSDQVMVISGIESLLARNKDLAFMKEGALELTLKELIRSEISLRLIMISEYEISTYHPDKNPRSIRLESFSGEELKQFYTSWRIPEEKLEKIIEIAERSQGHPMAMRQIAMAIHQGQEFEQLEQNVRGSLKTSNDISGVRKSLRKSFDKLSTEEKDSLNLIPMMRTPGDASQMQLIGINRETRMKFIANGLLEQSPQQSERRYYVHPITQTLFRKGIDFEDMKSYGLELLNLARKARQNNKFNLEFHHIQEANNILIQARKRNECWRAGVPFVDPIIKSIRSLIFQRQGNKNKKNLDVAGNLINICQKQSPNQPDVLLLEQILLNKGNRSGSDAVKGFDFLHREAGTPETYHAETNHYLDRNATQKGTNALRKGVKAFPHNGRLYRRLAGLLIRQSELNEAIEVLLKASEVQPLMADNFSLLGEALTRLGEEKWENAESAFDQAKKLGAANASHFVREANLLRARSFKNFSSTSEQLLEAEKLLRKALQSEPQNINVQVALATIILDKEGDLDEADKLLKGALKKRNRPEAYIQRARVLIRRKLFDEVETNLDRAYKLANNNHETFSVRGEYYFATGDVFRALQAFKTAIDRCPSTAPEKILYNNNMDKMKAIIESGQSSQLMSTMEEITFKPQAEGFRRDPGTIIRRKNQKKPTTDKAQSKDDAETQDLEAKADNSEQSTDAEPIQEVETPKADEESNQDNAPELSQEPVKAEEKEQ